MLYDGPASDDRYKRTRLDAFETILRAAGERIPRAALDRGYAESGAYLGRLWSRCRDVPVQAHVRVLLGAAAPALPGRLSPAVMATLVEAYARPVLLVPPAVDEGARAALERLRTREVTLALISNTMRTPGATVRKLLAHYGLLDHFAHTTFSDEVGVRKPDPAIFELTLRAVHGQPESSVHVGDDEILDVQGGRAAGLRVIQVAGGGRRSRGGPAADAIIKRLAELPEAIAALESR